MHRSLSAFVAFVLTSFSAPQLLAQSTWTGAVDGSWHDPGNWSTASVPTSTTDVIIPSVATPPSTYTADPLCRNLEVRASASLTLSGGYDLIASGGVTVQAGGTLALGDSDAFVAASFTASGAGAVVSGNGWIVLTGAGTLSTLSNTVPNLRVQSSGTATFATSAVAGDLELVSGTLAISGGATVTVNGDARLSGGTLAWETASVNIETLDIAGDATLSCAAGACNVYNRIYCAGNWSSSSAWAPVNDMYVVLDGAGSFSISGTDPRFPRLVIDAGTRTLQSAAQVKHALTISTGASLVCSAALDVIASVTLGGATATWDLGSLTHTVGTSYTSTGGSATGTGWIECDGTGTVATGTGSIANLRVSTSGTVTLATTRVSGDLELTAGTMLIGGGATVTVDGDARLSSGTLSWETAGVNVETLDIAGDAALSCAAGPCNVYNRIYCAGNWSSSSAWAPVNDMYVVLDGAGSFSISGTDPRFPRLLIDAGTRTLQSAAQVKHALTISTGASLVCSAALDAIGSVTLGGATATWDLGSLTHTVGTSYTSTGGNAIGTGWIECDGTGAVVTGTGSIANLRVNTSGTVTLATARVSGDLELIAGTLLVADDVTASVGGDARLLAPGIFGFGPATTGPETLDIAGDVSITALTGGSSTENRVRCGGNWSGDGAWSPTLGWVYLYGASAHDIGGAAPSFPNLVAEAGSTTLRTNAVVKGGLWVLSGAALLSAASFDIAGNVTLGDATSSWDLGGFTHELAGGWTSTGGSAIGTGWIECDGTGTVATGAGSIANLRVSTSGTVTLSTARVSGDLELTAGTMGIGGGATVTVNGDARLSGGTLSWETAAVNFETLDIAGDATLSCAAGPCNVYNRIYCAGNWSSSSAWAPVNDMYVVLDGAGSFSISGTDPRFPRLLIDAGTRTLQSAAQVKHALTISTGASLVCSAALDVVGSVTLGGATATWDLGSLAHTVGTGYTSTGGNAIGTGWIECDGTGVVATGTGSIANLRVDTSGTVTLATARVSGDLELIAGTLLVADDVSASVGGDARLLAPGIFGFGPATTGPETLDIAGDVSITALTGGSSTENILRCGGNWTGDGAWSPTLGWVYLYGASAHDIGGAAPSFPNLVAEAGSTTLRTNAVVKGGLWVLSGAALLSAASFDIAGNVTLGDATSSWDLGGFTHELAGGWTSTGGSAIGTGWIECDGTGTVATGTGSIANLRVSTSGTVTLATARVSGDLELIAGTLLVADDVSASVGGDARLLAPGIFGFGPATTGPETLDIAGDVSITALTGGSSTENRVRCGGNWSGDGAWSPTLGLVYLYGASAHDIGGAAPSFPNLIAEAGSTTLRTNAVVKGGLWVLSGATLLSAASFDIAGNVTLGDATSSWDLGGLTHTVGTSYTSTGGSAIGTGWIECDGTGAVATGAGSIANLRVNTSGTVTLSTSRVSGDLELLAGTMAIGGGATVTVEGDARLSGGTLSWETASIVVETMDIAGDATLSCAAGPCNVYNRLYCAGNWSSTSAWAPVSDMYVVLDGEGNFSISGTDPRFPRLAIAEGTYTLQSTANVKHALTILDGATLVCDAALDVDGNVGLGDATSAWDLGSFTHTIGTSYASTGGNAVGTGWIQCDGTGTVTTATGSIANLRVSTSGTVTLGSALITGDLELSSGTLAVAPSAQITVYEDARLTAGALSWDTSTATNERVYVEGDAALCCASLGGSWASHLHCRGNWVSNAAWAPGAGPVVHLDGSTSTTVEGLAPSFDPRFATLLIESGERVSAGDFDLQATSLTITSGAALRLDGQRVSLTVPSLQVQGALRVGAGSALELDATTQLTVAASGTLRCVGTTSSPAVVSGRSGGGYGLLVSGRLEAMNFVFAQMGVAGIRVASSAVLAPAPEDLRSGVFREGSSTAGACLLDVARTSAVELRYLRFENAGTATYNLRSTTFAPIRLVNWSGAFSGPAFEDDPNGVIEWSAAEATELGAFASLGAVQSVGISFDTVSESEDVVAFHVLRAESPSGPFQELSGSPLTPIGGPTTPASYALSDTGLTEYTQYFYKLEEELSHGGRRELATDSARPWPASIGDTVFVGPNGYATPAAALVAVPSGGTIVIAGGTYPSFEIDRPVMLMPATSDPVVIDTASAPLVVRDVSSGLVALYGLRVGTGAGTRGVEVQRCDAVVVLDGLTIDADPARDALLLDACSRAAVQSCAIGAGAIGRARNATRAHWSAGSVGTLVLESGSAVDTCGVVPGSVVVNPGCTHRALPGTMPRVDMQLVGRSARTQRFRVTGDPFAPFTLYFALGDGYLDLSAVLPIDMVLLLDLGLMAPFASGSLSVSGEFELALPVPTEPLLWGYRLPFQALVLRGAALRFSNVRHMLFVP